MLTIPHNSNLSGGLMFEGARVDAPGESGPEVDLEEAKLRERWEPLVEIMQHKGDSECDLRPERNDELCASTGSRSGCTGSSSASWARPTPTSRRPA